ncbi:molecular chaperone [Enterobacter sp. WCHEn045836]|nr:fimbria/pilus periplasmic chaperone [Enterobacter sp. WCHEn045836]RTP97307.1 molecular chaperone [Enterobacter sp. WCHEn045836]
MNKTIGNALTCKSVCVLTTLALLAPASAQAAIALDRTRVIFDGGQSSVSMSVSNQNKQLPYLAQGWIEDESGNKITSPLTVLPPVQRIEPGKPSQVKIQALPVAKQLPQDRETLYYFNLREIPPKSNKPNTLQIALQTRIKMFYRPTAIAINKNAMPPQEQITLRREGNSYVVNNPTAYYITIAEARDGNGSSIKSFEPVMVAPKGNAPLRVSFSGAPTLTYINDYGGRPELKFSCNGSTCNVVPGKKNS